jgi:RNA polymerase sigma-70 factor (ECF subfamily)
MNMQLLDNKIDSMNGKSEHELVIRLQNGESEVVSDIFKLYSNRIYSHVFYSVDCNQAIAEDITQEVFFHAFKSARSYKGNSSIFTWLSAIAHHKIADYFRRLERDRRFGNHSIDDQSTDIDYLEDKRHSGKEMAENTETRITVQQALAALPPDYRQVILLKYVEDMSVSEICQVMDRSPKSIEGLLSRARKTLKDNLHLEDELNLSGVNSFARADVRI